MNIKAFFLTVILLIGSLYGFKLGLTTISDPSFFHNNMVETQEEILLIIFVIVSGIYFTINIGTNEDEI